MRKILITLIAGSFAIGAGMAVASAGVKSLRGAQAIDAPAKMFDKKKQKTIDGKFQRAWKLQPPSIPHKIDKDRISLEENTCLKCHSAENYKKEKAPKIGDSHFIDASGKVQKDMSMRRYFCVQCHTPQADIEPLVTNTF